MILIELNWFELNEWMNEWMTWMNWMNWMNELNNWMNELNNWMNELNWIELIEWIE